MSIDNYDLFQKRLKTSATIPLNKLEEDKLKTFKIAQREVTIEKSLKEKMDLK